MNVYKKWCLLLIYINYVHCDLFTIASLTGGLASITYNTIKKNTFCRLKECCTENEIPLDINGM